jgi:hypothetical protein
MKFCVICGEALSETAETAETAETPETESPANTPYVPITPPAPLNDSEITPPSLDVQLPVEETSEEPAAFEADEEKTAKTETVEIKQKPKIKMFRSVPAAALSAVLGVCVFALIFSFGVFAAARYITYPETIEGIVDNTDFLSLPIDVNVGYAVGTDARSVGDAVYTFAETKGLTRDDVEYIYENASFRDEFVKILSGYAGYIRDGVIPPDLTADDIKQLFAANLGHFNTAYGFEMSQYDIDAANKNIELAGGIINSLSLHSLSEQGIDFTTARMLMSYPAFIAAAAIIILLFLLIMRINRKAAPALAVTGIAAFSAAALISLAVLLFSKQLIGLPETISGIIGGVLSYIAPVVYISSAAAALIGVILFVTARIMKNRVNNIL